MHDHEQPRHTIYKYIWGVVVNHIRVGNPSKICTLSQEILPGKYNPHFCAETQGETHITYNLYKVNLYVMYVSRQFACSAHTDDLVYYAASVHWAFVISLSWLFVVYITRCKCRHPGTNVQHSGAPGRRRRCAEGPQAGTLHCTLSLNVGAVNTIEFKIVPSFVAAT